MKYALIATLVAGIFPCAAVLIAQEKPPAEPDDKATEERARQEFIRKNFTQLTAKMIEVADLLEDSEPETARILHEAVSQAQKAFIAERMDEVIDHLRKGLDSMAATAEEEVVSELQKVLKTLREGTMTLDERMAWIAKLKEHLAKVNRMLQEQKILAMQSRAQEIDKEMASLAERLAGIIAEQEDILRETGKLKEEESKVRALSELKDEIDEHIRQQEKINEATATLPAGKLPVAGAMQERLAERTSKTAEKASGAAEDKGISELLRNVGADPEAVAKTARRLTQATREMTKASEALSRSGAAAASDPQTQALADLKAARSALEAAIAKASASTPGGKLAGEQGDLSQKTGELADAVRDAAAKAGLEPDGSDKPKPDDKQPGETEADQVERLNRAADEMDSSADKLRGQRPKDSEKHQENALKELKDREYELAQLRRKMAEKLNKAVEEQLKQQEKLAREGKRTSDEMNKPDSSGKTSPGKSSMASAADQMKQAAGKLSQGSGGQATEHQDRAVEDLERTKEMLEEAVREEEELAQAEALAKIDRILQNILDRQRNLSDETKDVYSRRRKEAPLYERTEQLRLAELSDGEGGLANEIVKVRKTLLDEGTTVVFPDQLQEVAGDLKKVQERLSRKQADEMTQLVQADIEQALQEMIDAIRKELSRRRRAGGGRGGGMGGGGGGPLVPPVAELKLLRSMQLRVNRRTASVNEQLAEKKLTEAQSADEHKALSEKEKRIKEMADRIAKRLNMAQPVGP